MDQDNTPKYDNEPYQPPSTDPDQPPVPSEIPAGDTTPTGGSTIGGAQIYDPNFPPAPGPTFTPPPPVYGAPVQPPRNNNRRIWMIVLIIVLLLCCCCVVTLIIGWNIGDTVVFQMCNQGVLDPNFCSQVLP